MTRPRDGEQRIKFSEGRLDVSSKTFRRENTKRNEVVLEHKMCESNGSKTKKKKPVHTSTTSLTLCTLLNVLCSIISERKSKRFYEDFRFKITRAYLNDNDFFDGAMIRQKIGSRP